MDELLAKPLPAAMLSARLAELVSEQAAAATAGPPLDLVCSDALAEGSHDFLASLLEAWSAVVGGT